MSPLRLISVFLLALWLAACSASADTSAVDTHATDAVSGDSGAGAYWPCGNTAQCEAKAAARLQAALGDATALGVLMRAFPKGGDLHNHMTGAVYAERYIAWASGDNLCELPASKELDTCSAKGAVSLPAPGTAAYDDLIAAWSMQGFPPPIGAKAIVASHDHFFATFSKFGPAISGHYGDILADLMAGAADERILYLELMITPYVKNLSNIADKACPKNVTDLAACLSAVLADPGFAAGLASASSALDTQEKTARQVLGCDGPAPQPGCATTVRYLVQGKRLDNNNRVFAELVSGYELAKVDPRVVGVNLVQPEDSYNALAHYDQHMQMVAFLTDHYGKTVGHVSLHAGELSPEVLSSADQQHLKSHVRKAVEVAHAERIGHGADLLLESDYPSILQGMKAAHIAVEVCPGSNWLILGVTGAAHPVQALLAAGVRVAIATDDQGVARSDLSQEYRRAVAELGLNYLQIKDSSRVSLEAAFVQGQSLWADLEARKPVAACAPPATAVLGQAQPGTACAAYLQANLKAKLQYQLEGEFGAFESQ